MHNACNAPGALSSAIVYAALVKRFFFWLGFMSPYYFFFTRSSMRWKDYYCRYSSVVSWWGRVYPQQVFWWYKARRSAEGPQQAGEMAWQEPHEVSQGKVQSPASVEEKPQARVHAGGQAAGKQLCRKGPESPAGHHVEQELTVCPRRKKKG